MKEIYEIINNFLDDEDNKDIYCDDKVKHIKEYILSKIIFDKQSKDIDVLSIIYESYVICCLRGIADYYDEYKLECKFNDIPIKGKEDFTEIQINSTLLELDQIDMILPQIFKDIKNVNYN